MLRGKDNGSLCSPACFPGETGEGDKRLHAVSYTHLLEGVAATESSNNGVTGGALIPLMTLGVPGDVLTAILLGALMIQGLTPGPLLFQEHGATVNGIFASFFVSNILILVVGLIAVRILGKVVLVPTAILMSCLLYTSAATVPGVPTRMAVIDPP